MPWHMKIGVPDIRGDGGDVSRVSIPCYAIGI